MNHTVKHRLIAAMLVAFATIVLASNTFAALNAYLVLKDKKTQSTFKCAIDQEGKFSFTNVPAGTYTLGYVCDDGGGTSSPPSTIEISSFSWGATNSGSSMSSGSSASGRASSSTTNSKSTPVTRSNISNNRTFTVDAQGPVVTANGVRVAVGDLDGDGIPDVISSPVTASISNADGSHGLASMTVILDNVTITSACSPSGKYKGNWDLKQNTK